MANQEHLDILRQGVDVWNEWRQNYPTQRPDLSFADLTSSILIGANLNYADLTYADINEADLVGASLRGALLDYANCSDTDFTCADLTSASLTRSPYGN